MSWIQAILNILSNLSEAFNRESSADEKIKDSSVKSSRNLKKAIYYAKQIFDGKKGLSKRKKFEGLDVLLKGKLDEKDYNTYLDLRLKFNKYS